MSRNPGSLLMLAVLAGFVLVSCGSWSGTTDAWGASPTPLVTNPPPGVPGHVDSYRATEWRENGNLMSFLPTVPVELFMSNIGRISMQTGCGWVYGDYDTTDGQLVMTNVTWGHDLVESAFCNAEGMRQDAQLATFVQSQPTYQRTADTLTLENSATKLTFAAES